MARFIEEDGQWSRGHGPKPVLHFLVKLIAPPPNFLLAQPLGESWGTVILVVVLQAEEHEIILRCVFVVSVEVRKLPLLHLVLAFQPETEAAAAAALQEDARLCRIWDYLAYHIYFSPTSPLRPNDQAERRPTLNTQEERKKHVGWAVRSSAELGWVGGCCDGFNSPSPKPAKQPEVHGLPHAATPVLDPEGSDHRAPSDAAC